jgi:ketosteroid isomerase-like protein
MSVISKQTPNERVVRTLYSHAEGNSKDTAKFVSLFADGGYFYDVSAGKKYYGADIGVTVDIYAAAFPDMHRELYNVYVSGDLIVVELSLNGTHKGGLVLPAGTILPTGKEIHAPCCDVFHLKDGKVVSFHCYVAVPILLRTRTGVTMTDGGRRHLNAWPLVASVKASAAKSPRAPPPVLGDVRPAGSASERSPHSRSIRATRFPDGRLSTPRVK